MAMIRDKLDPWVGKMGGWGQVGGSFPPLFLLLLLLLLLRGLTSSAGCQKGRVRQRTDSNNKEGRIADGLPAIGFLSCAEVQSQLSHLFCPLQRPDAAPLTHTPSLSVRGRTMMMDR